MVNIITGPADSGKSTKFLRLYNKQANGAGLYAKKLYNEGVITGYNLVLLPGKEEFPFVILKEPENHYNTGEYLLQGRFAFLKETFRIAVQYLLSHASNPVWIDEIGALELKGTGYDSLLRTLLASGVDLTFTVRDHWLGKILEKYRISDYRII